MDPGWVTAIIAVLTVITGLAVWIGRQGWQLGQRTWQFIEDWEGHEPSPGHPARPGVLERLESLTSQLDQAVTRMDSQDIVLKKIVAEVSLNSGHSVKDTVQRTESAVADLQASVNDLKKVTP